MASKSASRWIVTATGDRPIGAVAKDLAKAGLKVEGVLEAVGSITGTAPKSAAAKLRKVRGVADVVADAPIQLGPPDADETW
jgi:hypothetical protein